MFFLIVLRDTLCFRAGAPCAHSMFEGEGRKRRWGQPCQIRGCEYCHILLIGPAGYRGGVGGSSVGGRFLLFVFCFFFLHLFSRRSFSSTQTHPLSHPPSVIFFFLFLVFPVWSKKMSHQVCFCQTGYKKIVGVKEIPPLFLSKP